MTEVLHLPSSSPNSPSNVLFSSQTGSYTPNPGGVLERDSEEEVLERESEEGERREELKKRQKERAELSFLALLFDVVRKSLIACSSDGEDQLSSMDIGWPTNVRHVAHVTFDRFNGFLGLPVEFEPDVPRRAPSASTSVFGVSTESMQLSYDSRGNCVPTILILMQRRLYAQGGLQEEGIFRITAENSQEEFVRDQLNRGSIPTDIDVHCLAGLIKAWFRELPTGVLDPLSPEDVMRCESVEDCTQLVRQLPPTEASLLDWAINLMADVVQEEHFNKMNAHNIAMVFAPNMTQMADPLTALMYAVQVMNFLKTLITKRLQDREDSTIDPYSASCSGPSDESDHQSPPHSCLRNPLSEDTEDSDPEPEHYCFSDEIPDIDSPMKNHLSYDGDESIDFPFDCPTFKARQKGPVIMLCLDDEEEQKCGSVGLNRSLIVGPVDKPTMLSNLSRVSSRIERMEAWC